MKDLIRDRKTHFAVLLFFGLMQLLLGLARQLGVIPESPSLLALLYFGVMIPTLLIAVHASATSTRSTRGPTHRRNPFQITLLLILLLLTGTQIYWGAFTSLLDAGHVYNTFPSMYGQWIPPELWVIDPLHRNFFENLVTIQWMHRLFALLILLTVLMLWVHTFLMKQRPLIIVHLVVFLLTVTLLSYTAGAFTLIYHVPAFLTLLHQISAQLMITGIGLLLGVHFSGWIEEQAQS